MVVAKFEAALRVVLLPKEGALNQPAGQSLSPSAFGVHLGVKRPLSAVARQVIQSNNERR